MKLKKFEKLLKMKNKKSNTKKQTKKAISTKQLSTRSDYFSDICNNASHEKALDKVQWYEERNKILDKRNLELTKENLSLKIGLMETTVELEFYKIRGQDFTKSKESEKIDFLIQQNERLGGEKAVLQGTIDAWEKVVEDMQSSYSHEVRTMKSKILALEQQIKELNAKASQMPALQSELKMENTQKRALEAKIKNLDDQLKKPKIDECTICFEEVSANRKWTAFNPCGHRVCSDCADKFCNKTSAPRWPAIQNTNRQKCPHCRQNVNSFLVLEGIYGS